MPEAGQPFAHFQIIRKLGEGGMGEVFLAEDKKLNRQVALKTLSSEFLDNAERLERFEREARTAAQVNNSYVMSIYDISSARDESAGRDIHYIVMEYIEGKSLSDYLVETTPDFAGIVRIAEKIAIGLASAHKLNIVHRDIKPDNIIVDEQGQPSILDFGLAKPLDPVQFGEEGDDTNTVSQKLTQVGKIMGTVSYMSPEQVQGQPVDTRSDIFSFGILLYRMVTGDLPFAGPTQVSTMAKILESTPEPLKVKNNDIPSELERIISKCLQKDREDRYQDSRDLVVDLRNLRKLYDSGTTDSISLLADRPSTKSKLFSGKLSWKMVVLLIFTAPFIFGAIMMVILALTGELGSNANVIGIDSPEPPGILAKKSNSLAILGFANKTNDADLDWLQTGLPEILLTDLDSRSVSLISHQRIVDFFPMSERSTFTHGDAVEAAEELGASKVLSGTFYKLGDKLRIDAKVEDVVSSEILWKDRVVGDDPFALVDSLTSKITVALNISPKIAGDDRLVTTFTSSSPEAYKLYLEGMDLFNTGFLDKSIESFEKALVVDSTFALPYMRIGMANIFEGRQQVGSGYFEKALQYRDNLPAKDRNQLDIYSDLWLNENFDDAFVKMKTAVENYPDDKEIRTIHALLISTFAKDSTSAYAQMDTALMIDPGYPLGLEIYSIICENNLDIDKALIYCERLREYYPQAPSPLEHLPRLYRKAGRLDEAIVVAMDYLQAFPDMDDPYFDLSMLNVRKRDFANARDHLERLAELNSDNPYIMFNYYNFQASLANWEGKFKTSMDLRFKALEQARLTNDSTQLTGAYARIADRYRRYHMNDSMLYYSSLEHEVQSPFNKAGHPLLMVMTNPANDLLARPIFKKAIKDARSRLPSELWTAIDQLEALYDGWVKRDTARLIRTFRDLVDFNKQQTGTNVRWLGYLLVNFGQFDEGLKVLTPLLSGNNEEVSGFAYPMVLYYVGKANQGLGDNDAAIGNYQEMLMYWSEPELELEEIIDARKRLAELTS